MTTTSCMHAHSGKGYIKLSPNLTTVEPLSTADTIETQLVALYGEVSLIQR